MSLKIKILELSKLFLSLGGVRFTPYISDEVSRDRALELADLLREENRILPGGYIYLSDILGHPANLKNWSNYCS